MPTSVARKSTKGKGLVMYGAIKLHTIAFALAAVLCAKILAGDQHPLLRLPVRDLVHVLVAVLHYASTANFV